jgi:hypothetical protein
MSRQITISIPHKLSEAEIKSRLVRAVADARAKHPAILSGVQESWTANRMDFRLTALGQTITGDVVIEPQVVLLHITLPAVLAMLADRLKPQIEAEGRKMLEPPR